MAKKWTFKKEFKGAAEFKHLDPHMARFVVAPIDGVRGMGPITIEPDMFPEDFEPGVFDVTAGVVFNVEIKRKK